MSGGKKVEVKFCDDACAPVVVNVKTRTSEPVKTLEEQSEVVFSSALEKMGSSQKRKSYKIWGSRFGAIVTAVIVVFSVVLVGMKIAGFKAFTVMSGSMTPEYPVGALIYVKPVDYYSLKEGDVISFVAGDDNTVVTHRIVGIEVDKNDSSVWRFKTKGDANETPDAKLVHYKNVIGTPVIVAPVIGYIVHNVQQPPGIYITLVVGTLLLAWTFLPDTLEGRRKTARKSVA